MGETQIHIYSNNNITTITSTTFNSLILFTSSHFGPDWLWVGVFQLLFLLFSFQNNTGYYDSSVFVSSSPRIILKNVGPLSCSRLKIFFFSGSFGAAASSLLILLQVILFFFYLFHVLSSQDPLLLIWDLLTLFKKQVNL